MSELPPDAASPTARIRSAYHDVNKPTIVQQWENWANSADTDERASLQLQYNQLLQLRAIKLILAWTLIVIPVVGIIVTIVLVNAAEPAVSGF